jgi:hypothetical protein
MRLVYVLCACFYLVDLGPHLGISPSGVMKVPSPLLFYSLIQYKAHALMDPSFFISTSTQNVPSL